MVDPHNLNINQIAVAVVDVGHSTSQQQGVWTMGGPQRVSV